MDYRDTNGSVEILPCQTEDVLPICDDRLKPTVGKIFLTVEDGISFYKKYGEVCRFDIHLGPTKRSTDNKCIMWRYVYCNKEGDKHYAPDEGDKKIRRRISKRSGCMARMVLRFNAGCGYEVKYFIKNHNHSLVSEQFKPFMKVNRNIDYVHKKFVMDCARAAIGSVKSFRLFKEFVGRYDEIGCTRNDFKTVSREMKAFVDGVDAQMTLYKLRKKKDLCPAFTFEYEVDGSDKLTRLFWCDPICRRNYHLFGDIVSFDATYSTNRYCMIFAPFTGVDNHGKAVSFGAGLISREDANTYSWLFQKFKNCMVNAPSMIVTDQDLGMKVAIERVLKDTRHRFCMWHIMLKVAEKVPFHLKKDDEFKKKLCAVVWCEDIEPKEFESGWEEIMKEFGLNSEKWFVDMYALRRFWIPAYFRDFPFSGLIKTTSISESENSRARTFTRARDNLVEFFMHHESAIDAQRHANAELNYVDESCIHKVHAGIPLENHVATLYTKSMFDKVKEQIHSAYYECCIVNIKKGEGFVEYEIGDDTGHIYTVMHNLGEKTEVCSCKMFIRFGILCSHIFLLFKNLKMKTIPDKYIVRRWMKHSCLKEVCDPVDLAAIEKYVALDDNKRKSSRVMSEFYNCLGLVEGEPERMDEFLNDILYLKEKYKASVPGGSLDKQTLWERFYGSPIPKEVNVFPPNIVKTKGSGSRFKSNKEEVVLVLSKPLRKCSKCLQLTNHDARNCKK